MTKVTPFRRPVEPLERCSGCDIPLLAMYRSDDPKRCASCKRGDDYREAVEQFVRGTDPDSAA